MLAPPTADWGGMISDAQNYYTTAWWFIVFPGGALLITTLAFNLFGDGVRDAFDPRVDRLIGEVSDGWCGSSSCGRLTGLLVLWLITRRRCSRCSSSRRATSRAPWAGARPRRRPSPRSTHRLGLDQPLWKQYLDFVGNALHGDLGYDYYHQVPVTTIIAAGPAR